MTTSRTVAILVAMSDDGARLLAFAQAPDAIELRHLRAFVAVAIELNFGRAAAQLYVSQPALSRQIRSLETLVGCELLRRSTHRVELTLAGEALLDRARRVLREVDEAVVATRSVGGELAERAARLWAPITAVWGPDGDLQAARAAYETLMAQFERPPDIEVRSANAGGVPALDVGPPGDRPSTVLYLHGGGHALGSAFGYQGLAGALAAAAGVGVLVVEYRLAPEHPFPAALDDAVRAYTWLIERTPAEQVTVAGDSSGGGLAMSLLIRLKQDGLPLPGGAMLFCPWVDLTLATLAAARDGREPVGEARLGQTRGAAEAYLAGHRIDDPLVSPLTADLSGLPPLLIQAATGDPQMEDAHQLNDRAGAHGVQVRLELYPVDTHVFHIFWAFLPEAADALEQAGAFVREAAHSAGDPRSAAAGRGG
jgi:acetyl esterase/lipase